MTDDFAPTSASTACECDFAVLAKGLEIHDRKCPTIAAARSGRDHLADPTDSSTTFVSDAEDAESIDLLVTEANEANQASKRNLSAAEKRARLGELAQKRRESRWPGYSQPEDYDGYDFSDLVSPFTRSAGNVDTEVMLFLQDWASHDAMTGEPDPVSALLGHNPARVTNVRLKELLNRHLDMRLEDTYATNLFPFIKPGGMSAAIPARDLQRAAMEFGVPQVEIVGPRVVVALGRVVSRALRSAGIEHQVVSHPAARISNARRDDEWSGLAAALETAR